MAKKRRRNFKKTTVALNLFLIFLVLSCGTVLAYLFLSHQKISMMILSKETIQKAEEILNNSGFSSEDAIISIEQENYDKKGKPYFYSYKRFEVDKPVGNIKKIFEENFPPSPWPDRVRVKTFGEEKTDSSILTVCRIGTLNYTFFKVEFLYRIKKTEYEESVDKKVEEIKEKEKESIEKVLPKHEIKAKIAIIIDDVGSEPDFLAKKFFSFPEKLTFAVLPYLPSTLRRVEEIKHLKNFEIILHQPMEAENMKERGLPIMEGTILTNMTETEIFKTLEKNFKYIRYARGMNNHQGSLATSHQRTIKSVIKFLKSKNFFFVDSFTSPDSIAWEEAKNSKLLWQKRDVFLDNEDEERYIQLQFNRLIQIALREKIAVGIGHATREATFNVLLANIERTKSLGIEFVWVSEILKK